MFLNFLVISYQQYQIQYVSSIYFNFSHDFFLRVNFNNFFDMENSIWKKCVFCFFYKFFLFKLLQICYEQMRATFFYDLVPISLFKDVQLKHNLIFSRRANFYISNFLSQYKKNFLLSFFFSYRIFHIEKVVKIDPYFQTKVSVQMFAGDVFDIKTKLLF